MKERKRKQLIKRHARDFLRRVQADHPGRFENITLPQFGLYRQYRIAEDATGAQREIAGYTESNGNRIEIYGYAKQKVDDLKMLIRHEMIHAILAQKGFPNKDTDTVFLLLAIQYNAYPYSLLQFEPGKREPFTHDTPTETDPLIEKLLADYPI